jgi:6-phosphogluconolactonase (cycloisomerase 2 family)
VANFGSNNVSAFTIDPRTGALTAVGVPVISGASPSSLAVEPTGRFAYVTNRNSSSVSVFAINPNTGALAAAGLPVDTVTGPISVTVDLSGKFAYVASDISDTISTFAINATTRLLRVQHYRLDLSGLCVRFLPHKNQPASCSGINQNPNSSIPVTFETCAVDVCSRSKYA